MQARGPVGKVRVAMLDETWIPDRRREAPGGGGDGRGGRYHPAAGGLRRRLRLAGLAGPARGLGRGGGRDGRRLGLRSPLEAHGLDRQQCMVHMRRTFTRRLRKLPEEVRERYAPRLKRLRALLRALPAEGAAILMGWLEEAVDPAAPAPKEWRSLVQHFLERWNQMRIHCRAPDVPATTNRLEGRFRTPEAAGAPGPGLPHAGGRAQFPACGHAGLRLTPPGSWGRRTAGPHCRARPRNPRQLQQCRPGKQHGYLWIVRRHGRFHIHTGGSDPGGKSGRPRHVRLLSRCPSKPTHAIALS